MRKEKLKMVAKAVALGGLAVAANAAMAQTATSFGDMTTGAVTLINGDIKTGVMAVGGAVIGLAAVAMGIRWVKATFF